MRNFPGIVLGKTRMQIRSNSRVEVRFGNDIRQQVDVVKIGHRFDFPFYGCCCPASSAAADYVEAVFPSGFARLRPWLAKAKKNPAVPDFLKTGGPCSKNCEFSLSLKTFADIAEWFLAVI